MFFMESSVYRCVKLLLKKPVNIDHTEALETLFDRLPPPFEDQSAHQSYLLPKDSVRMERSCIAISVNGISKLISGPSVERVNPNKSPITRGKLKKSRQQKSRSEATCNITDFVSKRSRPDAQLHE